MSRLTEDEFNALAWRDFVLYAFASADIRAEFTKVTGTSLPAVHGNRAPIEWLIDTATSNHAPDIRAALVEFIEWVTIAQWGIEQAPKAFRDAIAEKEAAKRELAMLDETLGEVDKS